MGSEDDDHGNNYCHPTRKLQSLLFRRLLDCRYGAQSKKFVVLANFPPRTLRIFLRTFFALTHTPTLA